MNAYSPSSWGQTPEGGWGSLQAQTAAQASVAERMSFVRKVYALFFVGILFAVGGVGLGFTVPGLMMAVASHPWITLIAMIGAVFGAQAVRHVPVVNLAASSPSRSLQASLSLRSSPSTRG
ncbi:MAG: hypothetical protein WKF84_25880 [Pyrinomonadaceae bacterium]